MNISAALESCPVVPLVQADDAGVAVNVSQALAAGGLTVAEVVLRTDRALDCLRAVADEVPDMIAGAGTVLTAGQARQAIDHGAKFVVSPGLDDAVVATCQEAGVPIYPGVYTPSEIQHAVNLGLDVVKFFPASIAGGVQALKAFAGVFRTMRFMPTGGISPDNLAEYLAIPAVLACGGSWLTPADAIAAGEFETITRLAEEALSAAADARGQ
ncbi:MAG: bifunctional 4-hydroxy-2-oxoglutarate aldolase/2-dehydro-3-deoxy-phosphogluconate aldolase [Woeseiaceae bacterium]|nr:bifunctional 4-hydroxy-2-oxoglutarate aldolase/2-dehydro-3-deoxy-phosphogluconate aldolase [Woeseiaceae bacterium]